MTADRTFVDTNVLVYAYDRDAGDKRSTARAELAELWEARRGAFSTQVLQEFYVNATRKLPKPVARSDARAVVDVYESWEPYRPTTADIVAASELEDEHQLSFWDALIVISAERSECTVLLSEDLQDGRRFGGVTVVNPFTSG